MQQDGENKKPKQISRSPFSLALGADEDDCTKVAVAETRMGAPRSFVFEATKGNVNSQKSGHERVQCGGRLGTKRKRARKTRNALKIILSPSFHISVTITSPVGTTLVNVNLTSLNSPNDTHDVQPLKVGL